MKLTMMDWLLQNSVGGFSRDPFSPSPLPRPAVCRRIRLRVSSPVPLKGSSSSLTRVPPSLRSLPGLSSCSSQGPQGCHLPSSPRSHQHHVLLGVFPSLTSFSEWEVAFCLPPFSYPSNKCTNIFFRMLPSVIWANSPHHLYMIPEELAGIAGSYNLMIW